LPEKFQAEFFIFIWNVKVRVGDGPDHVKMFQASAAQ
jgi:hypothetical protein